MQHLRLIARPPRPSSPTRSNDSPRIYSIQAGTPMLMAHALQWHHAINQRNRRPAVLGLHVIAAQRAAATSSIRIGGVSNFCSARLDQPAAARHAATHVLRNSTMRERLMVGVAWQSQDSS
ncbi:hypothetical protein, partial [Xanthomonas oryzae]|uniref:hypothetical protein n=1 Tax=Xanthomonas oryzae TaxID=347 RepID=UPI001C4A0B41